MQKSKSLSLAISKSTSPVSSTITSPTEDGSDTSSLKRVNVDGQSRDMPGPHPARHLDDNPNPQPQSMEKPTRSPELTSLPPFPSSPQGSPKRHTREPSKGFFSNLKASKSSNKVHQVESTIRQVSEEISRSKVDLEGAESMYSLRKSRGSTPDLGLSTCDIYSKDDSASSLPLILQGRIHDHADRGQGEKASGYKIPRRPVGSTVMSDSMIITTPAETSSSNKAKPRFGNLLTRTRSIRVDDGGRTSKSATPIHTTIQATGSSFQMQYDGPHDITSTAPMTAPLQPDRSMRDIMSSNTRNHSADRRPPMNSSTRNRSADRQVPTHHYQDKINKENTKSNSRGDRNQSSSLTSSSSGLLGQGAGVHLFNNIKNTSSKAAGGLGKASKGFLGKMHRSGSNSTKEDERYVLCVINLPLVEQTRITRIASSLEDSKDKTEFWMPALPWRCIDYLNFRGAEEEGLYRVPGSDVQIRHWQKRFDQEYDVDLFEEEDLYDVNIIGSMFKAWLRELPTEIFPKATQSRIAKECAGAKEVPQLLKDELSLLPPWNYYLLFAITCHLSLLSAYSDKNRMTYGNLCICFQPALKVDAFCFQFLVNKWRECWQGCWTEKEATEEENRAQTGGLPSSSGESSGGSTAVGEERSSASSASNKPNTIMGRAKQSRPPHLNLTKASDEQLATPQKNGGQNGHARTGSQLPKLAPVKPLSPIDFERRASGAHQPSA